MKYELLNTSISPEVTIVEEEKPTDKYWCIITLEIHPTDNVAPNFNKTLKSISDNSQTGFEVDKQRQGEIEAFLKEINL